MLPLTAHDKPYKPGWRIKERVSGWLRLIFSDKSSRNMFLFLLLNLSMAFVELAYGVWTNSLGLISDSFHMFFDCTALLAGLAASLISRWRPNDKYPYGYVRAEVLAGFVNGLFLIFIAFFIFSEAVERAVEPPEVHHERLFLVSIMGFLVNLVGIFAFQHGGSHHGHSHGGGGHGHSHSSNAGHGHSHDSGSSGHEHSHAGGSGHGHSHASGHSHDEEHGHSRAKSSHSRGSGSIEEVGLIDHHSDNHHHHDDADDHHPINKSLDATQKKILQGVFLHILADTLGSVGVIISSALIHMFGWMIADPICSMFIAALIGISVVPLLGDSLSVLMQRQPKELDSILPGCFQRVSQLEGVYSVQEPHFWTLCSDVYIGALKLEVAKGADTKYILSQTHNIFSAVGVRQLYVQIDTSAI